MAPTPPNCRPSAPPSDHKPKWSRLGAVTWTARAIAWESGVRGQEESGVGSRESGVNVFAQEGERPALLEAGRFFDGNGQAGHFAADFVGWQDSDAGSKDRGFEHRVLGPIEAEERPQLAAG